MAWFHSLMARLRPPIEMVDACDALPGRPSLIMIPGKHFVNGNPIAPPFRSSSSTTRLWSPTARCSDSSGKATTRHKTCGRATTTAPKYRSAIYTTDDAQLRIAQDSARAYADELATAGCGKITTELAPMREFYYAEDYHQQYLAKNPNGYCGSGGTGVACAPGLAREG